MQIKLVVFVVIFLFQFVDVLFFSLRFLVFWFVLDLLGQRRNWSLINQIVAIGH